VDVGWKKNALDEDGLKQLGRTVSLQLRPGAVIALTGGLGAGKTVFAKAVAEGLGVTDRVVSPTFTLINEYGGGRLPMYHLDVYRLDGPDIYESLEQLGWEDYFYGDGVCVVEWADMIRDAIPPDALWIDLSETGDPSIREVSLTSV
jgi:tRNA threonylcarbamoyladenosine biosynthesis protein TsaE